MCAVFVVVGDLTRSLFRSRALPKPIPRRRRAGWADKDEVGVVEQRGLAPLRMRAGAADDVGAESDGQGHAAINVVLNPVTALMIELVQLTGAASKEAFFVTDDPVTLHLVQMPDDNGLFVSRCVQAGCEGQAHEAAHGQWTNHAPG